MITKYISIIIAAVFVFSACEDEAVGPILSLKTTPAITAPASGSKFVLTEANASKVITDFTWTAADFGYPAGISYKLEMDKQGNSFRDPLQLGITSTKGLSTITVKAINDMMNAREYPNGVANKMELRLVTTVSPEVAPVYSAAVPIEITPYEVIVVYPQLQVPGGYQGWNPGDNSTVIFSLKSNKKYEGYLYIKDDNAEFKYTDGPSWTTNWGDDGANGTLEPNGANIKAGAKGVYKLNVDLVELKHTFVRTNWGLIGSATPNGWNSDQDMTYDIAKKTWSITLNLVAGEIKFRANDDWAINFGDDGANLVLEYGGANIAIASAGNYTIELNLSGAKYKYTIKKN